MRLGFLAGCVAVAAVAVFLLWKPAEPATAQSVAVPARLHEAQATPSAGRTFLTSAQLDQALRDGTLDRPVKSVLAVRGPLQFGDYRWNDAGVPQGRPWIRVDLASQLISVFRAGHEIGTAVIVYGGKDKETPTGKFHILAKDRDHQSSIYDAEMPYTLQLTGDGVSIHGSSVRWGAATHGCIGVPLAFASKLFDAVKRGDEVVIVRPRSRARMGKSLTRI